MQKKLLTLAVAGALGAPGLALAQSSVEVYGTVHMSFGNVSYSAQGTTGKVSKWDVANHASNYGFRGRESLGGGMTAWFQIEQNAPLERSNNVAITPASRNSAVGIQGAFGNVFVGQWTTPWADLDGLWSVGTVGGYGPVTSIIGRRETTGAAPNPYCVNGHLSGGAATTGTAPVCDAVESGGGVGHPFWRRPSQAVFYQSPVFNGMQVKIAYQTNEGRAINGSTAAGQPGAAFGASNANPSLFSSSVQWSGMGGAARVGFGYDRHNEFTASKKNDTGFTVKGGYNFGVIDLGLAYEKMTYQTAAGECQGSGSAIAVAFPVATGAIRGSWSKASDLNDAACGAVAGDNGATQLNIGYEHRFSKRTQVGFGYARIDNDVAGVHNWTGLPPGSNGFTNGPVAGQDITVVFVNMVHRF
jgi:predicted porin